MGRFDHASLRISRLRRACRRRRLLRPCPLTRCRCRARRRICQHRIFRRRRLFRRRRPHPHLIGRIRHACRHHRRPPLPHPLHRRLPLQQSHLLL